MFTKTNLNKNGDRGDHLIERVVYMTQSGSSVKLQNSQIVYIPHRVYTHTNLNYIEMSKPFRH